MRLSDLPDIYCLGLKALGPCNYDLSSPSLSFFSIGQLATVVALIFTFSQLAKPIIKFRIATRVTPEWLPWLGIAVAIICVFGAAVFRVWQIRDVPVIGYPIFWEFIAGVSFVAASLLMIYSISTRTRLSPRNAMRYLDRSRTIIARGNADDLRDYGDEIGSSVSVVIKGCKSHQTRSIVRIGRESGKEPPTEFERVCYTLLDLWADAQFCQLLVTRCPATAIRILLEIQNEQLYESGAYALVQSLIDRAMADPDSMLHREGDYSGLGRAKSFMSSAFGRADFVRCRLRPLEAWQASAQEHVSAVQMKRYGDAIELALKATIEEGNIDGFYGALIWALEVVNRVANRAAWSMTRISEPELSQSEWSNVLHECGVIHGEIIDAIAAIPDQLQPGLDVANIDPATYESIKDHSIYAAVAKGAYEYVESLAMCKGHDGTVRLNLIGLWQRLFRREAANPNALLAVRQRFLVALREKIDQNLDPEHWFYPVVTRVLLAMWGIPNCKDEVAALPDRPASEESQLYVKVLTQLKHNYVSIRRKNLEYAENLLPNGVEYVETPPSLRQAWFRGQTTTLVLNVAG